jgi:hypothetical protein
MAVRHTAKKIHLQNTEWKSREELLSEIKVVDKKTFSLLMNFINAYEDCHENSNQANIIRRNEARSAIIKRIKSLHSS